MRNFFAHCEAKGKLFKTSDLVTPLDKLNCMMLAFDDETLYLQIQKHSVKFLTEFRV